MASHGGEVPGLDGDSLLPPYSASRCLLVGYVSSASAAVRLDRRFEIFRSMVTFGYSLGSSGLPVIFLLSLISLVGWSFDTYCTYYSY